MRGLKIDGRHLWIRSQGLIQDFFGMILSTFSDILNIFSNYNRMGFQKIGLF